MFQRIITNYAKNNKNIFRRFSIDKNNFTTQENITNTNTNTDMKLILQYGLGFFAIGGCVEVYTFSETKDINKSTGLGWSTLTVFLICL